MGYVQAGRPLSSSVNWVHSSTTQVKAHRQKKERAKTTRLDRRNGHDDVRHDTTYVRGESTQDETGHSREVEAPDALLERRPQFLAHDRLRAILRQLEVVHARHHAREVIVRGEGRFVGLAHDRQRGVQASEACAYCQQKETVGEREGDVPPMGNLGLPVMNWR